MKSVEVEIFGRKFRLRCDDPTATYKAAETINDELLELKDHYESLDFSRLLLLVALKKQTEIFMLSAQNSVLEKELDRLNQMVGVIVGEIQE